MYTYVYYIFFNLLVSLKLSLQYTTTASYFLQFIVILLKMIYFQPSSNEHFFDFFQFCIKVHGLSMDLSTIRVIEILKNSTMYIFYNNYLYKYQVEVTCMNPPARLFDVLYYYMFFIHLFVF